MIFGSLHVIKNCATFPCFTKENGNELISHRFFFRCMRLMVLPGSKVNSKYGKEMLQWSF